VQVERTEPASTGRAGESLTSAKGGGLASSGRGDWGAETPVVMTKEFTSVSGTGQISSGGGQGSDPHTSWGQVGIGGGEGSTSDARAGS